MRKHLIYLLFLPFLMPAQKTVRALFIGNSYTAVNNLPQLTASLALSKGDTLLFDSNTPGGQTLQGHCGNATTLSKIAQGTWDYVIIQAQSQEPSFSPGQVASNTLPYAMQLDSLIHAADSCVETVFYMTWGRKNGDASNCAAYPPVCTYSGMQGRLRESYLLMGQQNSATVAPVGCVWREVRNQNPVFDLYQADESHPSIWGSYVAACTFYEILFQKTALGASFISTLPQADASLIQQTANTFMRDSLSLVAANGNIPFPSYSFSESNGNVQFTNTSVNGTNYSWNFGDGNNSSSQNPSHTYTSTGNYVVSLTLGEGCMSNVFYDTVSVSSVGTEELLLEKQFSVYANGASLFVENKLSAEKIVLHVFSAEGKQVLARELTFSGRVELREKFAAGVYFVQLVKGSRQKGFKVFLAER